MHGETKKQLSMIADIKATFGTPSGKRVLRYLMKRSGFMNTSFVQGDPNLSAFNEGQRALVIDLVKKMRMDIMKLEQELTKEPSGDIDVII
jgi:hypothetical protein